MTGTKPETPAGQPLGDTGGGETGVPEFEQGISNRSGDKAESGTEDANTRPGTPQGARQDDEKSMKSEGQLVEPPEDVE